MKRPQGDVRAADIQIWDLGVGSGSFTYIWDSWVDRWCLQPWDWMRSSRKWVLLKKKEVWVLRFQKLRTHGLGRRTQEVEGNPQESMGTQKESEEFPGDGNDLQLQMGLRIQLRGRCGHFTAHLMSSGQQWPIKVARSKALLE